MLFKSNLTAVPHLRAPPPQTMTHGGVFRNCIFSCLPPQFTMANPWFNDRGPSPVSLNTSVQLIFEMSGFTGQTLERIWT